MWVRLSHLSSGKTGLFTGLLLATGLIAILTYTGCGTGIVPPPVDPPPNGDDTPAKYVGTVTCAACHPDPGTLHDRHGHSRALTRVEAFTSTPALGTVPNPPAGFVWSDISYLMGGFAKSALFVDTEGFLFTYGTADTLAQYNLANPAALLPAAFVPYKPEQVASLPFDYDCFRCHTTGPESLAMNGGRRQDNRLGIEGTWSETGVQCEACHGPGSRHLVDPAAGEMVVDTLGTVCGTCHVNPDEPDVIAVEKGSIIGRQQFAEVAAGPHRGFSCTICHDPHASILHDRDHGLRNACVSCHADVDMASHENNVFQWGDYVETLRCESCHMPLIASNASCRLVELPGDEVVSIGDTRSHLMHIDTYAFDLADMFSTDGAQVRLDEQGRSGGVPAAAVCQRCHHGLGNAFTLTVAEAGELARNRHVPTLTEPLVTP